MRATVLHRPRDIRCEEVAEPKIQFPTDAIIKLSATCICGSDLWPYRGLNEVTAPMHMGHEYCGIVVEVGSDVRTVRPGQFVVGSFCISDNTCPHCQFGFQSSCVHREFMSGARAPYARVPLADGTLVATREVPPDDLIPHFLATSDVLGTGWYAADAAGVREGGTVVVVGDGAVGLFVDEAAQMSLANLLAVSQAARSVVLIGDPQQLEQPMQGSHPEGTDVSALHHLLDGKPTIDAEQGLFLAETWRLHPNICRYTSELFYSGRLHPRSGLEVQRICSSSRFSGTGLRYVPVITEGNQSSSPEEADCVRDIVEEIELASTPSAI